MLKHHKRSIPIASAGIKPSRFLPCWGEDPITTVPHIQPKIDSINDWE